MSDMTSATAIDLLDNLIGMIEDNQENDYDTAFHMAIDALKAQAEKRTEERTETHELFGNSEQLPSAQPDIEKICARIKAEAIKRNVEYMKHGDRYMLGFVDGMRLARRIVDGTIDDPVYFTVSGE